MHCVCAVLYCHLWPVKLYIIVPHNLTNGTIFGGEKIIEHRMCFFIYSTNLSEKFLIRRRIHRDIFHNCTQVFMQSICYSCYNLTNLNFFSTDFRKILVSNFMKIRQAGAELFLAGIRDEANSRFSQVCERALKPVS